MVFLLFVQIIIAYFATDNIGMENKSITLEDVNRFLEQFKVKASVFGIIYRVREKNEETLFNLGISAQMREKIVLSLEGIDFSHTTLGMSLMKVTCFGYLERITKGRNYTSR